MAVIKEFFVGLFSKIRAFLRLILVTVTFFLSGLNSILFAGREVAGFTFTFDYLQEDIDKLSYVDKLNMQLDDEESGNFEEDLIFLEDEDEDFE